MQKTEFVYPKKFLLDEEKRKKRKRIKLWLLSAGAVAVLIDEYCYEKKNLKERLKKY